ncbi:MAG: helix-turn-helix domain-containing protein [Patescibacteria group bacterium]|jgi:hypothetical protein
MTDNHLSIQDESGDKKYFTLVPNYILNHSSSHDQSLYLQMKRYAGENGKCTASEKTLMAQMKVGRMQFKKSLKYLVDHKWIRYDGEYVVNTPGGPQKVKTYTINDIWKMNTEHYQGVSETTSLPKGVSENAQRGVQNDIKGVAETTSNKNKDNIEHKKRVQTLSIEDVNEDDFQEIATKYQIPVSFVRSKYDDMVLWAGERPGNSKTKGRNWKLTLMRWVKTDAIKIKSQPRKGGMIHVES